MRTNLLLVSLAAGIAGYAYFERLPVLDAFLNTAMLLGGMGPVDVPKTTGGKLFAGLYALYAGLVFIVTAALILTPVMHRALYKSHWMCAAERQTRSNIRSQTPWPSLPPRVSNFVTGRHAGRGAKSWCRFLSSASPRSTSSICEA